VVKLVITQVPLKITIPKESKILCWDQVMTDAENKIYREIREKLKPSQYFDLFTYIKSVKLDGTYTIDELKFIIETFEKHLKEK